MKSSSKLGVRLALAFICSTTALAAVCLVALVTLVNVSERTRTGVSQGVDLLRDAAAFDALLYQKGFVADYMLTRDPIWLQKLEDSRVEFAHWIAQPRPGLDAAERKLLAEIMRVNDAYDRSRREAIDLFDAGDTAGAVAHIPAYHVRVNQLLALSQRFSNTARVETEQSLLAAEHSIRKLAWLLVAASLLSALSSLTVGFLWARRIARPLYQLQLQVESAAARTNIRVAQNAQDTGELAEQITALVQKAEEADAALAEQRRRLIQTEKLSAIGELAAKLAHEILNPLAGMKAAVQLMGMQAEAGELSAENLHDTGEALGREVTRIEQLIRRLIGYARPLSPHVEVCTLRAILEQARAALRGRFSERTWPLSIQEDPGVPPLELDPLLMTQVFVNLYRNAAEAMHLGGRITTCVRLADGHGRREVHVEVKDEGPGIAPEQLGALFTPFHSTKRDGHGLGLATSRNIVVEHGGVLEVRNRSDRPGAVFCVCLPLLR